MSQNGQSLRLGMFVMPIHDPNKPLAQCFDEDLELAVRCDELGFDDFWVGTGWRSGWFYRKACTYTSPVSVSTTRNTIRPCDRKSTIMKPGTSAA